MNSVAYLLQFTEGLSGWGSWDNPLCSLRAHAEGSSWFLAADELEPVFDSWSLVSDLIAPDWFPNSIDGRHGRQRL